MYREATVLAPVVSACWYNLAVALKRSGDIEAALRMFKKAIKTNPKDSESHRALCTNLFNLGRISDAVEACTEGIMAEPRATSYPFYVKHFLADY